MSQHRPAGGLPYALEDPAFEPQPIFDFDESHHDEHGYRHMQQGIAHLNVFNGRQTPFGHDSDFGLGQSGGVISAQGSGYPSLEDTWSETMAVNGPSRDSEQDTAEILHQASTGAERVHDVGRPLSQSEIVKSRRGKVSEQYGNLTPPEEALFDGDAPACTSKMGSVTENQPRQAMDRSERARNAAIQRHAKTKRQRKESKRSESDADDSEGEEVEDKREKYREKNRAAAAKCRAKKKTHVERVEQDARSLETENALLKARVRELRNQHAELRDLALQHNQSVASCRCTPLHQYNMSKAAEITSSITAFAAMRPASTPSQDSLPSVVASPRILEMGMDSRRSTGMCGGQSMMEMLPNTQPFDPSRDMSFARFASPEGMSMSAIDSGPDNGDRFADLVNVHGQFA